MFAFSVCVVKKGYKEKTVVDYMTSASFVHKFYLHLYVLLYIQSMLWPMDDLWFCVILGMRQHGFNELISERIGLHRNIPDERNEM